MQPEDKKGEDVEGHFGRLFPIHYLYLRRKPQIAEQFLSETVGPPRYTCVAGLPCPGPTSTVTPRPGALALEDGTGAR